MTVVELIEILEEAASYDPDMEVRLAFQPRWPFEHSIGATAEAVGEDESSTFYIAEGHQIGYLPGEAAEALGW